MQMRQRRKMERVDYMHDDVRKKGKMCKFARWRDLRYNEKQRSVKWSKEEGKWGRERFLEIENAVPEKRNALVSSRAEVDQEIEAWA